MTRAYFEDIIRLKVEQERKRIVQLLLAHEVCGVDTETNLMLNEDALIARIEAGFND
jgi:hypothetical protein